MLVFTVEIVLHVLVKVDGGGMMDGLVVVRDSSNGYVNNIKMIKQR